MIVSELIAKLQKVNKNLEVTFQGNIKGEYDTEEGDTHTHTSCIGHLFEAFDNGKTLVLDCAITNQE